MARPLSRYLRVNLRMLFVFMTVCALWLGYLSKSARDQRAAVQRIHQLGGSVSYDFQYADGEANGKLLKNPQPPGWPWLRWSIGAEYFQDVVRVDLNKTAVENADLRLIGKLTQLNTLSLNSTGISDAGLEHLGALWRLRYLGLSNTQVTSNGMRVLNRFDSLDTLILEDCPGIGNEALEHIKTLTQLEMLGLGGTSITSAGVSQLAALKKLDWVTLRDTSVDDSAVESLVVMSWLRELDLSGSQVSGPGLLDLRSRLPSCRVVCDVIDLHGEDVLKVPKKWQQLLSRMQALNDENRLKLLDLSSSTVADDQLPALYRLNKLEAIDLRNTKVTKAGVGQLQKALPGCKVFD